MNRFAHSSSKRPLIFGFVLVPAALWAVTLAQNNPPPRSPDPPVLIWDIDLKLANSLPRNFRTTNDPLKENKGETPSTTGLSDLRASGSGEFTPESLKLVLTRTRGPVTVFDLRQETHIFVNALPVSWYASHDWANVDGVRKILRGTKPRGFSRLSPAAKLMFDLGTRSNTATAILSRRNA